MANVYLPEAYCKYLAQKNFEDSIEPFHFEIEKVIFHDPATIIYWKDGTKTVVKVQEGDCYDPEIGMVMAIAKKALGNRGNYYNVIKHWVNAYNEANANINPSETPLLSCSDTDYLANAIRKVFGMSDRDDYNG